MKVEKLLIISLILYFSAAIPLMADRIHFKSGRVTEGTVISKSAKRLVVDIGGGQVVYRMKDVRRIEKTAPSEPVITEDRMFEDQGSKEETPPGERVVRGGKKNWRQWYHSISYYIRESDNILRQSDYLGQESWRLIIKSLMRGDQKKPLTYFENTIKKLKGYLKRLSAIKHPPVLNGYHSKLVEYHRSLIEMVRGAKGRNKASYEASYNRAKEARRAAVEELKRIYKENDMPKHIIDALNAKSGMW